MHAIAVTQESATQSIAVRVGIDLAKDVFELAFAEASGRIIERVVSVERPSPRASTTDHRCGW